MSVDLKESLSADLETLKKQNVESKQDIAKLSADFNANLKAVEQKLGNEFNEKLEQNSVNLSHKLEQNRVEFSEKFEQGKVNLENARESLKAEFNVKFQESQDSIVKLSEDVKNLNVELQNNNVKWEQTQISMSNLEKSLRVELSDKLDQFKVDCESKVEEKLLEGTRQLELKLTQNMDHSMRELNETVNEVRGELEKNKIELSECRQQQSDIRKACEGPMKVLEAGVRKALLDNKAEIEDLKRDSRCRLEEGISTVKENMETLSLQVQMINVNVDEKFKNVTEKVDKEKEELCRLTQLWRTRSGPMWDAVQPFRQKPPPTLQP